MFRLCLGIRASDMACPDGPLPHRFGHRPRISALVRESTTDFCLSAPSLADDGQFYVFTPGTRLPKKTTRTAQ